MCVCYPLFGIIVICNIMSIIIVFIIMYIYIYIIQLCICFLHVMVQTSYHYVTSVLLFK